MTRDEKNKALALMQEKLVKCALENMPSYIPEEEKEGTVEYALIRAGVERMKHNKIGVHQVRLCLQTLFNTIYRDEMRQATQEAMQALANQFGRMMQGEADPKLTPGDNIGFLAKKPTVH